MHCAPRIISNHINHKIHICEWDNTVVSSTSLITIFCRFRSSVDRTTKSNMFIEMNTRYIVKYCADRNIDHKCTLYVSLKLWFYSFHESWCPKMLMKPQHMYITKWNKCLSILFFFHELTLIFPNIASIWISDTLSGVPFRTTCRAISAFRDFATSAALEKKYLYHKSFGNKK